MISVKSQVSIYEQNGEETAGVDGPKLEVSSHWNCNDRVDLMLPGGKRITVIARDLIAAITNATNSARF